jgi:hypothetical protein
MMILVRKLKTIPCFQARHFPRLYEHKLKTPNVEIINEIVQKIEGKYGRLKVVLVVGNTQGKVNFEEITKFVEQGDHLRYVKLFCLFTSFYVLLDVPLF